MGGASFTAGKTRGDERHASCFGVCSSSITMSHRAHFWLRLVGLALILAAEFGPRLWTAPPPSPAASLAGAVVAR